MKTRQHCFHLIKNGSVKCHHYADRKEREHILPPTSSQFYTPLQYMHIIKYCVNLLTFQWKHTPIKTTQTCKQHPTAFTLYKENTCFITLVPWIDKKGGIINLLHPVISSILKYPTYTQCTRLFLIVPSCSVLISNSTTQHHLALFFPPKIPGFAHVMHYLTRPGLEPTIYRIRGEHANH